MEVTQTTAIKLSKEEYNVLTKLIDNLYNINDDDEYIGQVMNDIYNAHLPVGEETLRRYDGYTATIIVMR